MKHSHTFSTSAIAFSILLLVSGVRGQNIPITVTLDQSKDLRDISPLIYGINAFVFDPEWKTQADWKVGLDNVAAGLNVGQRRLGGNTMTSYNWENGFSNSGVDSHNENSEFQSFIAGTGNAPYAPGAALTAFHGQSQQVNASSLLELPCAGYVAADGNGAVTTPAPSDRWDALSFAKPGAPGSYTLTPDLNDNTVYVDEELNFLISKYGNSATANGIKGYELDNEPGLWHTAKDQQGATGTHPLLHAALTTCQDLLLKNIGLAVAVKLLDPNAMVYGPAMWGYPEYFSFWSVYDGNSTLQPPDWPTYNTEPATTNLTNDVYRYNHMTWINAYLSNMKSASANAGKRLLDVFSMHYYALDSDVPSNRVQAPRSLWDPTYVENSYITMQGNGFTDGRGLQLIPTVQRSIADFYPDTKLAFTEWDFGGRHDISGTIAQADALGIFGRYGVYAADYFFPVQDFIAAAFRIYRNYDGSNGTFGETSFSAVTSDIVNSSCFASIGKDSRIHIIFINKSLTQDEDVTFTIPNPGNHVYLYQVSGNSPDIVATSMQTFKSTYTFPKASVTHLVIQHDNGVSPKEVAQLARLSTNPANRTTMVLGSTSRASQICIKIYDDLGRIAQPAVVTNSSCAFSIPINVERLPVGAYQVVVDGGTGVKVLRMMVIR